MEATDEAELKETTDSLTEIFRKALGNDKLDVKVEKMKNENISSMITLSEESRRMQELNEYVNKEKSRAKQIFRKAVKMRKAADNLQQFRNGQLSLDDYFGGGAWRETTSK